MKIDVLHIDECPNWERAGTVIEEILSELGASDVRPNFVLIRTPEEAAAVPFAGSPTILIDGVDPFPGGFRTTDLACRVYRDGQRMAGLPSHESLRRVLVTALAG
jgi:hypothetical protein